MATVAQEFSPQNGERAGTRRRPPVIAAAGPNGSKAALDLAALIAARTRRPLSAISVVEPQRRMSYAVDHVQINPWKVEEAREARREQVSEALRSLNAKDDAIPLVPTAILIGDAPRLITDLALATDAALIVMGTGGHALPQRLVSREITLATARRASCPVLAVHPSARGLPKRVVIAMDFSAESIHAARSLRGLLDAGAALHVVHVWKPIASSIGVSALDRADDDYARTLPERFQRVLPSILADTDAEIVTNVCVGDAAAEILQVARDVHADLIVAGMRGLHAIERLFIGSVSTALLRGATCSLLLVPSPAPVEYGALTRLMQGTSTESDPRRWNGELEAFVTRNAERPAQLELIDVVFGAQQQLHGYPLTGAAYEGRDRRIALMFGGATAADTHLTHTITGVQNISIASADGRDSALCIATDDGRAIVTFLEAAS